VVFFSALAGREGRGQRRVVGLGALDDLQQGHDRDRVEEVEADDPLGVVQVGGHLGDRQRGGVRREHALRAETTSSTSAKTCFLTPISSKTASMTKSASAKPDLLGGAGDEGLEAVGLVAAQPALLASLSSSPWT
jgi:hypothetical protein